MEVNHPAGSPRRESGFVHDLCLALAHRLDPERLFVIFTVYMDESGSHRDAPVMMMAGYLGTVRQWERYEKEFAKLRREFGFSIFHTKDLIHTQGEFRGWSRFKKFQLASKLHAMTAQRLSAGFSIALRSEDFKAHYLAGARPKKVPLDTMYALLFRAAAKATIDLISQRLKRPDDPRNKINFVLESGHPNAGDAVRVFDWFNSGLAPKEQELFGELTFASKAKCSPLAAADFVAYTTNMIERDDKWEALGAKVSQSPTGNKLIHRATIGPETLRGMRETILQMDAEQIARGKRIKKMDAA